MATQIIKVMQEVEYFQNDRLCLCVARNVVMIYDVFHEVLQIILEMNRRSRNPKLYCMG